MLSNIESYNVCVSDSWFNIYIYIHVFRKNRKNPLTRACHLCSVRKPRPLLRRACPARPSGWPCRDVFPVTRLPGPICSSHSGLMWNPEFLGHDWLRIQSYWNRSAGSANSEKHEELGQGRGVKREEMPACLPGGPGLAFSLLAIIACCWAAAANRPSRQFRHRQSGLATKNPSVRGSLHSIHSWGRYWFALTLVWRRWRTMLHSTPLLVALEAKRSSRSPILLPTFCHEKTPHDLVTVMTE